MTAEKSDATHSNVAKQAANIRRQCEPLGAMLEARLEWLQSAHQALDASTGDSLDHRASPNATRPTSTTRFCDGATTRDDVWTLCRRLRDVRCAFDEMSDVVA